MNVHWLNDNLSNSKARIKRRIGVLKHDLDTAFVGFEFLRRHRQKIFAFEHGCAFGGFMQSHKRQTHSRLTGARLAHYTERFTFDQIKRNIFYSLENTLAKQALTRLKIFAKSSDSKQNRIIWFDTALSGSSIQTRIFSSNKIVNDC